MKRSEALGQIGGRSVEQPDPVHRNLEGIRRDLHAHSLQALSKIAGADIDQDRPVRLDFDTRVLLRTRGAALDETADAQAVIAAVDQLSLQAGLLLPFDLRQAPVEGDAVIAAVELLLLLQRRDGRDLIGHLLLGDQIAAPKLNPDRYRGPSPPCRTGARGKNRPRTGPVPGRCRSASCWSATARTRRGCSGCGTGRTGTARHFAPVSSRSCVCRRRRRHRRGPRSARIVPSVSQAISISQSASREWFEPSRFSRRSSVHLTGRFSLRAANGIRKSSG